MRAAGISAHTTRIEDDEDLIAALKKKNLMSFCIQSEWNSYH